jgi:ESS family glutamate:Na+ symporter
VVWAYILPITAMSIVSGILTTIVIVYLGGRIDSYNLERTVAIYGTCTGTVSSGLLLLRIVDPEFSTPVAIEIGIMNVIVVPIIVGCMVLVNAPVWWSWSVALTSVVFGVILVLSLVLLKLFKLWHKPKFTS